MSKQNKIIPILNNFYESRKIFHSFKRNHRSEEAAYSSLPVRYKVCSNLNTYVMASRLRRSGCDDDEKRYTHR